MRVIPTSFQLMGQEVTVEESPDIESVHGSLGLCLPDENRILIQASRPGLPETKRLQTFWHEAIHMAFHSMGEEELYENEKVVDLLGSCVFQILKTKRRKR